MEHLLHSLQEAAMVKKGLPQTSLGSPQPQAPTDRPLAYGRMSSGGRDWRGGAYHPCTVSRYLQREQTRPELFTLTRHYLDRAMGCYIFLLYPPLESGPPLAIFLDRSENKHCSAECISSHNPSSMNVYCGL